MMRKTGSLFMLLALFISATPAFALNANEAIDEIMDITKEQDALETHMRTVQAGRQALKAPSPDAATANARRLQYIEFTTDLLQSLGSMFALNYSKFQMIQYTELALEHATLVSGEKNKQDLLDTFEQVRVDSTSMAVATLRAKLDLETELAQLVGGAASESWWQKAKTKFRFNAKVLLASSHVFMASALVVRFVHEPSLLNGVAISGIAGITAVLGRGILKHYRSDREATAFKTQRAGFLKGVANRLIFGGLEGRESWKGEAGQFSPRITFDKAPRNFSNWFQDAALHMQVTSCDLGLTSKNQPAAEPDAVIKE